MDSKDAKTRDSIRTLVDGATASREGRVYLGFLLAMSGMLAHSRTGSVEELAYDAGRRSLGLSIYSMLADLDPYLPMRCLVEKHEWEKEEGMSDE